MNRQIMMANVRKSFRSALGDKFDYDSSKLVYSLSHNIATFEIKNFTVANDSCPSPSFFNREYGFPFLALMHQYHRELTMINKSVCM